jgi:hypothetical protein
VAEIDRFDRAVCRASALRDFHYLRMARDYVAEYERELGALSAMATLKDVLAFSPALRSPPRRASSS